MGNFETNSSLQANQLLDVFTYNLTEILHQVIITTSNEAKPKIVIDLKSEYDGKFVTKYDKTFGRCYSLELAPNVTLLGLTKIEFFAKLNIYIYLHHPGQYMDVDSKSKV